MREHRGLHILLLSNSYPDKWWPHSCVFIERQVRVLRDRGIAVEVVVPHDTRTGRVRSPWKYFVYLLRCFRALRPGEYDLVHAHFPFPAGVFGVLLAKILRIPLVVTSHGAYVDDRPVSPPLRALIRAVIRSADVITGAGGPHCRHVEELARLAPGSVIEIIMGVVAPPELPPVSATRTAMGIGARDTVVVVVGNLIRRKGFDLLFEAAAAIRPFVQPFTLVIGGDGEERAALEAQAVALGVSDMTRMIGAVPPDEVFATFAAGDIAVVPSRSEAVGLVCVEAMVVGTPVIVAEIEGLAQLVTNDLNGLTFRVGDSGDLASVLTRALRDSELRRRLALEAKKTARTYSVDHGANQIIRVYQTALHRETEAFSREMG